MILVLAALFSWSNAHALTAKWMGIAGVALSDGKTTLLFDPTFTKPTVGNWIFGSELKSDPARVRKNLEDLKIKKADAVFASHTHFDHAVDIATVSEMTGATIYGGASLERIVKFQNKNARFVGIKDRARIKVGDFTVIVFARRHAPIIQAIQWEFLPDEVPTDFSAKFYQYGAGETWGTVVEHPEGNILIDQSAIFFEPIAPYIGKIKTHFVGVSNKISMDDLLHNNIERVGAKKVIPLHFDFFFLQSDRLEKWIMPSSQFPTIREALQKAGKQEFHIPVRNQEIKI